LCFALGSILVLIFKSWNQVQRGLLLARYMPWLFNGFFHHLPVDDKWCHFILNLETNDSVFELFSREELASIVDLLVILFQLSRKSRARSYFCLKLRCLARRSTKLLWNIGIPCFRHQRHIANVWLFLHLISYHIFLSAWIAGRYSLQTRMNTSRPLQFMFQANIQFICLLTSQYNCTVYRHATS
jgi:hypothetical protein